MKIQTGRGTIPLITLIAIWSISAFAYIGRPYQNLSESDRPGYSDVDFAAIVADYPFYPFGW